jgi:hypothetical protein
MGQAQLGLQQAATAAIERLPDARYLVLQWHHDYGADGWMLAEVLDSARQPAQPSPAVMAMLQLAGRIPVPYQRLDTLVELEIHIQPDLLATQMGIRAYDPTPTEMILDLQAMLRLGPDDDPEIIRHGFYRPGRST